MSPNSIPMFLSSCGERVMRSVWFVLVVFSMVACPRSNAQAPGTNFTGTNVIHFFRTNYFVSESAIVAQVTVVRDGPILTSDSVAVDYTMLDGTARSGVHYFQTSGTLVFPPGIDRQDIFVPIIDNFSAGGDVSLTLLLLNPTSGTETKAVLGDPVVATLTILDDESAGAANSAGIVELAPGNSRFGGYFGTLEEWNVENGNNLRIGDTHTTPYGPAGVEITIVRKGGSRGRILVDWATDTNVSSFFPIRTFTNSFGQVITAGGIANPLFDFVPTNGTVVLDDYQMATNVVLRLPAILQPEPWSSFEFLSTNRITPPPKTFAVHLTGVRAAPEEAGQGVNPTLGQNIDANVSLGNANYGFCFSRAHYVVREGQRYVRVRVRRSLNPDPQNPLAAVHVHYVINPRLIDESAHGGDHQGNIFPLEAGSDYTTPFIDYEPPGSPMWTQTIQDNGIGRWVDNDSEATISWGDREVTDKFILVPIRDDNEAEFNEDMEVILWKHPGETDGVVNSFAGRCTIKIIDNDQPAGASEVDFNPDSNPLTDPPYMTTPGANNTVQALVVQPDGKVILGGDFNKVNTAPRNGIARLNFDGSTDKSFNVGSGVAGFVRALALQPDGRIIVAGEFDAVNGVPRFNIARLLANGSLDATFNPGLGTDGPVRTVAVQEDGKILVGGDFLTVDGTNYNYFARLNRDGRLDTTFKTGAGPSGPVNSIALSAQPVEFDHTTIAGPGEDRLLIDTGSTSGQVTINYDFGTNGVQNLRIYYGAPNEPGRIAIYDTGLINSNGVISISYPPAGVPATSTFLEVVMNEGTLAGHLLWSYHIRVEPAVDSRIVIGGEFPTYDGTVVNNIARLNPDGTLDTSFQTGTGADDAVYAVAKQGNKIIMAGDFRSVNLLSRNGVAKLNENGTVDTGFDPGSGFDNTVFSLAIQPNGRPLFGGAFRSFNQTRRIGLARLNLDGSLDTSFMDTAKNQFAGIPNPLSPENTESQENFIRSIAPYRITNLIVVTNFVVDTNGTTNMVISTRAQTSDHVFVGGHFSKFGGGFFRDDIRSRLNIARLVGGETPGPGNISLMQDVYSVDENAGTTFITLTRTNGSLGPISARFDTSDRPPGGPGTATAGVDYVATNYFPLWIRSHDGDRQYSDAFMGPNFNAFTTNRERGDFTIYQFPDRPVPRYNNFPDDNVFITVIDDNIAEGDELLNLTLSRPDEGRLLLGGQPIPLGVGLGKSHAVLTIADNDFNFGTLGFSDPEYFVNENETNAIITVTRLGGASGAVTVDVSTQDGTAQAGSDYTGISKRTLTFANGQTTNRFIIPIRNDTVAELEETVKLFLTNASGFPADIPAAKRLDPARATATLNIIDDDFAAGRVSFSPATYTVGEAAGEVTVTIQRRGGNAGDFSVDYRTQDGTAKAGKDYTPVSGTLHWTDRDASPRTITIPIADNFAVEPDKTFNLLLNNATMAGVLGAQTNATIRIQNDDAPGTLSFSQATYSVDENGPYADITVIRQNGVSGAVSVHFAATNITAIGTTNAALAFASNGVPDYVFPEYSAANGFTNVLNFAEGQTAASFRIPLIDDSIVEGEKKIGLALTAPGGGAVLGSSQATLNIVDDELNRIPAGQLDTTFLSRGADDYIYTLALAQDGKIYAGGDFRYFNDVVRNRIARLQPDGSLDSAFDSAAPNDSVRAIDIQPDGRALLGGIFTLISGTNVNHVARLNVDASVDATFNPGAGADNPVLALVEQEDGKVILVGSFSTYRGVSRKGIARVSTNGVLDTSFNPGTGANGTIWAVALQRDGKILIGGDFTTYNEQPRNRIARLNPDGSLDNTFGAGLSGADGSVRAILVQSDGNILVGGLFTKVNDRPYNRIARLKWSIGVGGQIDDTFTLGFASDSERATNGANGAVSAIAVQLDGKILIGGDFTQFNNRTRNRISRLNSDGSLDPTINFGAGANGPVSAIVVQPDRKILLAGGFTEYDGTPALHIARIHGGALSGSGQLQFTSPFFSSSETNENAVLNIRRTGGTLGTLKVTFITTTNDTAIPGQDFRLVTNVIEFPEAETFRSVLVPLIRNTNALEDRFVTAILTNVVGPGSLGSQPNARLTIVNSDSRIEFSRPDYSITENFVSGAASITIRRIGSVSGTVSVDFRTQDDTATAGADYGPVNTTITFAQGESSRTVSVPVFDDTLVEGNERVNLLLTNLVGNGVIGTPQSVLTIIDNDFSPGQVEFASSTFLGSEASGRIVVTLRRVGGTTGVISVDYATRSGGDNPAQPPSDYTEVRGIVAFADGEDLKSFIIPVVNDTLVEGNETIIVSISNPKGGTSIIGPTEATAIIVDDDLPPGSLDRSFDPGAGANAPVRVVKVDSNSRILIGGDFTAYNGVNRSHIARISTDADLDSSFNPGSGPNGAVVDIALDPEGKLLIGGAFNTVQSALLSRVARLQASGEVDPSFSLPLGLNGEVSAIVRQPDGKILVGGMFDLASAAGRNHIARLNPDGTVDVSFNPGSGADGDVYAIALQPDGRIVIGGAFGRVNGSQRSGIARLNADGSVDSSFSTAGGGFFGGAVRDIILLDDGSLIVVGDFTSFNTAPKNRVAKLKADGSLDESFDVGAGPNRVVYSVARQQDGKLIIGGDFTTVAGVSRTRIARLNANGSNDADFKPGNGANGPVLSVAIQPEDSKILIAGQFTQVDNVARAYIARLNNDRSFITPKPVSFASVNNVNGQLQLSALTQAGFTYTLESATEVDGPWQQEETVVADGSTTLFNVNPSQQRQFFRIRREQ